MPHMSYQDPYGRQQPPPHPSVAPPPPGRGYPPIGGYPPAQPYAAPRQPLHYAPPTPPQPAGERNDGNSWGWQITEALLDLASGSSSHGLGNSSRDRVKTVLVIFGIAIAGIALLVTVAVLMSK
ncbi:hypothetical protein QQ25_20425 [Mycolicibacterium setense]|nr:hypothetical protein QQ25_20425 [Mycolicibacterium setense]